MTTDTKTIEITRDYPAPRELVFRAWTEAERLQRWYAPLGCSLEVRKFDATSGGTFHMCIKNPEFGDCWTTGTFDEVTPPERLVFRMKLADASGLALPDDATGKDPEWPSETIVTVVFVEHKGGTRVTLFQNALESVARRTGAYPSWLQMLDRLEGELETMKF